MSKSTARYLLLFLAVAATGTAFGMEKKPFKKRNSFKLHQKNSEEDLSKLIKQYEQMQQIVDSKDSDLTFGARYNLTRQLESYKQEIAHLQDNPDELIAPEGGK